MSTSQSNLSNPAYGYDLVVASTQKSINLAMKEFLDGITAPEVIVCYVYDNSNNLVPISYDDLKRNANGADPFTVHNGADPNTNPDLKNLINAGYAGGFKAQIGLPDVDDPTTLPPIVTLGAGVEAPVTFNLLCSEFQISGFDYGPRNSVKWVNVPQPHDNPWYFTSQVNLNLTAINPNSPVPPSVQEKIQELLNSVGPGNFSIQHLFLDLDTAILLSAPTIVGVLPADWPVLSLLLTVFLDAYIKQLQKTGHPVLGYSCTVTNPDQATLKLGAISRECCPLVNGSGNPIINPTKLQQDAATFNYLCSTTTVPPTPMRFEWNWVELDDLGAFSGVQAIRRDIFVKFLATVFDDLITPISYAPAISWSQQGSDGYVGLTINTPTDGGAQFTPKSLADTPVTPGDSTEILSLDFHRPATASISPAGIGFLGDWFSYTFNYNLTGDVSVLEKDNSPYIKLRLHARCWEEFAHHEAWIAHYHDLPGANYIDSTVEVLFQISVTDDGKLVVNPATPTVSNKGIPWVFYTEGLYGLAKDYRHTTGEASQGVQDSVSNTINGTFTDVASSLQSILNNAHSWVFPGSGTFMFSKITLSNYLDLVTQTTYIQPS